MSAPTLHVDLLTPDETGWSTPPLSTPGSPRHLARALAAVFVAGPWQLDALVDRGGKLLGRRGRWLRPLVRRMLAAHGSGGRPPARRVAAFLLADGGLGRACGGEKPPSLAGGLWLPPVMNPAPGPPSTWTVPPILTPGELAERLGLTPAELDWFADRRLREPRLPDGPLRHYRYRWQAKRLGSARLVESPKPRLKAVQRRLLHELFDLIPPHDAAHGFRAGRSVRTFVAPHVGQHVVIKMDLRDFFPTITDARVTALLLTAGYPEAVARLLSGLCTNSVPAEVWDDPASPARGSEGWRLRRLYQQPHLPQGAPTSPALANLCAFRVDRRLSGLARAAGAHYTRYADDLVFSGGPEFARSVARFPIHVAAIALEEGFTVQTRKTRIMRRSVRQRVAGVVVNDRPNIARAEYDALKALLFNCVRHGPGGQDRIGHADFRAHLAGRIAYVSALHPSRGQRLSALFERIVW
ncbi:MAG: reverse transcriptase family protein [Isosphaeraceae bacterium]|nr:reverse transcriptase family protein [Isosphaeraceae bacterium]